MKVALTWLWTNTLKASMTLIWKFPCRAVSDLSGTEPSTPPATSFSVHLLRAFIFGNAVAQMEIANLANSCTSLTTWAGIIITNTTYCNGKEKIYERLYFSHGMGIIITNTAHLTIPTPFYLCLPPSRGWGNQHFPARKPPIDWLRSHPIIWIWQLVHPEHSSWSSQTKWESRERAQVSVWLCVCGRERERQ